MEYIKKILNGSGFTIIPASNLGTVRCYCNQLAHEFQDDRIASAGERELTLVPLSQSELDNFALLNPVSVEYAISCMSALKGLPQNTILLFGESKLSTGVNEWLFIANRNIYGEPVSESHLYYSSDMITAPDSQIYVISFQRKQD
jgi:hypothetical protein